jgi:condensin complex subunit 3
MSLAKLCISEDPEEFEEVSMVEVLLDTLAYDPSAYVLFICSIILFPVPFFSDVRRTVLLAIPINPRTLPRVLERTMDTDVTVRKLLYSAVLERLATEGGNDSPRTFGPTHPRILSIAQRELIIRNGLGDRDSQVRAAAASLLATWVDVVDVKAEEKDVKVKEQVPEKTESGILSLLTLFDLGEGTVAEDALLSIFKMGVDIFKFDGKNSHFLCAPLFIDFFRFHRQLLVYLDSGKSISGKSICGTLQGRQR